ncbi:hypothetical protein NM688_g5115 [Phlebia brevispora]|uniref:Uncharacterized protein n=1 Tax=Phlebia brevispora TaxID=194682 RepID=A0ACC1T0H3_9APHY|nr:hypothetical protein NM688_g5115 [Phlebia brevispora]
MHRIGAGAIQIVAVDQCRPTSAFYRVLPKRIGPVFTSAVLLVARLLKLSPERLTMLFAHMPLADLDNLSESRLSVVDDVQNSAGVAGQAAEVIALRARHSIATPIARLPSELLSAIFMIYARSVREEYIYSWKDIQPYSWIRVSHVCRFWREVAISYSALWSWIVPASDASWRAHVSSQTKLPSITSSSIGTA